MIRYKPNTINIHIIHKTHNSQLPAFINQGVIVINWIYRIKSMTQGPNKNN